jgi:serine/threonine-protein phosphatase 4 regulatory subunit 1
MVLNPERREELADIFIILQNDQKKWRIRECIATQISKLAEIFSIQTVFTYLVPMSFKLCSDIVSCVREEAAIQIGDIFQKFTSEEGKIYLPALIENIKGFSSSSKYTQRQTYIQLNLDLSLSVEDSSANQTHCKKHLFHY